MTTFKNCFIMEQLNHFGVFSISPAYVLLDSTPDEMREQGIDIMVANVNPSLGLNHFQVLERMIREGYTAENPHPLIEAQGLAVPLSYGCRDLVLMRLRDWYGILYHSPGLDWEERTMEVGEFVLMAKPTPNGQARTLNIGTVAFRRGAAVPEDREYVVKSQWGLHLIGPGIVPEDSIQVLSRLDLMRDFDSVLYVTEALIQEGQ